MDRMQLELWTGREVERVVALLESQSWYYQEILASLPVGAVVVSNHGRVLSANRAFRRLLGVNSEQLQNNPLSQILPSAQLQACLSKTISDGGTYSGIAVEIPGRALHASVIPVRSQDGSTDSEALVTVEGALDEAPHEERRKLTDIPGLVWTMRPDTLRFDWVEGASEHLLGYSLEHWQNTPHFWLERVHVEDRPKVDEFYRAAIQRDGEYGCDFRAVTASGNVVWCRDTFRVVSGPGASIHGITTDITARREWESDNLQASRVDALVGLSGRLSHDLNNALMIVTGYGEELLSSMAENDVRRADVHAILSAAETMAGLTGELQGFTRKQASPPEVCDIAALLTEVSARIRQELGASLVTRLPQAALLASADSTQLEAALVSIARHLRSKTDPHMILAAADVSVHDMVHLAHALKPGRYVEIAVRGPYLSTAPAPFFEAFVSGKDPHESDMARTYAIVREWGGTILTGRTEHTSEIRVLLPAASGQRTVPERVEKSQPGVQLGSEDRDAETVLVVEDENGIRELIRKILTREGYRVLPASSAEQAIDIVRRNSTPIRLLLADLKLPGKTGRELAEELAMMQSDLRVIYISGYPNDPNVTPGGPSGAALLQKPFTLAALLKKVHEALHPTANG